MKIDTYYRVDTRKQNRYCILHTFVTCLTLVGGLVLIMYCTCYEMCVQENGILNLCSLLLYAVCGKSKSSKKGHCISTKPWWIWMLPSVRCCLISVVTCYKFWECDNLLEFDESSCYFWIFHSVGTLAFVVWCLYKIFWGVCLFCVSWILLQESLKMLEGNGTEEDPQEQRWDHMLFIVLWTEWAIALVCVHYVTPLHGWL